VSLSPGRWIVGRALKLELRVAPIAATRRSRAELVVLVQRLASLVLRRPGLGIMEISRALRVPQAVLKVPLRLALSCQLLRTEGRACATRYFATPHMESNPRAATRERLWQARRARVARASEWQAVAISIRRFGSSPGRPDRAPEQGQQPERHDGKEHDGDRR
jgi:hypothetical protein